MLSALLPLTAAAANPPSLVPDAEGSEIIGAIKMGCKKPYRLTDCNVFSGPKKKIVVAGVPLKVAGTEDGKVIVMFSRSTINPNTQQINTGYEMIKKELSSNGIDIARVKPVASGKALFGYAIETEQPAYHLMEQFAE